MKTINYLKIVYVIIVGLVVISCSSDDEYYQGIGTPPVDRRIISYEVCRPSYNNGTYDYAPMVEVSYDSRKRISTIEYLDGYYYYSLSFDYENMNIYKKIMCRDEEYNSEIVHFNMNSQGYITKLFGGRDEKYGHDVGYEYIYEDGYLTKVYFYQDGDSCLEEEREYREGNLSKVTTRSYNNIYRISYSDDDNVSNFDPCFLVESISCVNSSFWGNTTSMCKVDFVDYFFSIPSSTVILSSVGLFGKNSVKLPKRIFLYGDHYWNFDYVLDESGYVHSIESTYSNDTYVSMIWDFSYKKY